MPILPALATQFQSLFPATDHGQERCRYATTKRTEYAFADLRRRLAQDLGGEGFGGDCADSGKPPQNGLLAAVMALVA